MSEKKKRCLSQPDFYQLCKLVEGDKELVPSLTRQELADRFTPLMEMPISESSVVAACKSVGVQYLSQRPAVVNGDLTGRVVALEKALERVEALVVTLYGRLDEELPQ